MSEEPPERNQKFQRQRANQSVELTELADARLQRALKKLIAPDSILGAGHLWAVSKHWNEEKYPNQRVLLLPVDGYIFAVPFVEDKDCFSLKTAFPSRKLTKQYRKELEENEKE